MRKIVGMAVFGMMIMSCDKDYVPDYTDACIKGDVWMKNTTDTFGPNHSKDSFSYVQGPGYYRFVWNNSNFNYIQLDLNNKPPVGQTIVYGSQYVRNIQGRTQGLDWVFDKSEAPSITIINNGSSYKVIINPIQVNTLSGKIQIKGCGLIMKDTLS